MNHCYDCNSSYERPGTCNCYALGGKRYVNPSGYSAGGTVLTIRYRTCGFCSQVVPADAPHFCNRVPSGTWMPA